MGGVWWSMGCTPKLYMLEEWWPVMAPAQGQRNPAHWQTAEGKVELLSGGWRARRREQPEEVAAARAAREGWSVIGHSRSEPPHPVIRVCWVP